MKGANDKRVAASSEVSVQIMSNENPVTTATSESFRAEVIEASATCPVVADFWADWCQPCRQLMPILEKLAEEFVGRFRLVKINVDESPEIAGALGVQSIPFVLAFVDRQPVSQLSGAQDEAAVRRWLESFLPSVALEAFNSGVSAEAEGRLDDAEKEFRTAVGLDDNPKFSIALARVLLTLDRTQECSEIISTLEARGFLEPEAEALRDQLVLRSEVQESGGTAEAREVLRSNPDSRDLQIHLAEALGVDKRFEEACEILLDVIRSDFGEHRDRAKEAMVSILTMMGPKSQLAGEYRRQLATAYY